MATPSSPAQTAAALLLGQDVCEWIDARKSQADDPSWRIVTYDLNRAMGDDRLVLSEQTVKTWYTSWRNDRKRAEQLDGAA